jgi:hypothetical protein
MCSILQDLGDNQPGWRTSTISFKKRFVNNLSKKILADILHNVPVVCDVLPARIRAGKMWVEAGAGGEAAGRPSQPDEGRPKEAEAHTDLLCAVFLPFCHFFCLSIDIIRLINV